MQRDVEQDIFCTYQRDGVYQIQCVGLVPGPGHVYATLIVGEHRALLFDTGWGEGDLRGYVEQLTSLPVVVVNSHGHPDHAGGNYQFEELWIRQEDEPVLEQMYQIPEGKDLIFPAEFHYLSDGQRFDLGGRTVSVLPCRGHTWGSVCLYDDRSRLLLTGDALSQRVFLQTAQPPIPLKTYYDDLIALQGLDFSEFLAGHHPQPFQREWVERMKGMIRSFSPDQGRIYEREGMPIQKRTMLYTVGRGFGDPEYCGFAYNEEDLPQILDCFEDISV